MGSERGKTVMVQAPPQAAFEAALGVAQHEKKYVLRGVHNEGRKLIIRQKMKALSSPKIILLGVFPDGSGSGVNVLVMNHPSASKALLDGVMNGKYADKFLADIQASLEGTITAPATPVTSHFVRDDGSEVPWEDADTMPDF